MAAGGYAKLLYIEFFCPCGESRRLNVNSIKSWRIRPFPKGSGKCMCEQGYGFTWKKWKTKVKNLIHAQLYVRLVNVTYIHTPTACKSLASEAAALSQFLLSWCNRSAASCLFCSLSRSFLYQHYNYTSSELKI